MPREGYLNYRITEERVALLAPIKRLLRTDNDSEAIDWALRQAGPVAEKGAQAMNEERIESKAARIAQRIIENGRAATNEELQEQFEFDAGEAGWSDEDIRFALKSPWFPWLKK